MILVYLVLSMAAVTYIPRMLPLVLFDTINLPTCIKQFMEFLPYAALGALIFPGILTSNGTGNIDAAIVGGMASIVLSVKGCNLILVVLGGILGAVAVNMFSL